MGERAFPNTTSTQPPPRYAEPSQFRGRRPFVYNSDRTLTRSRLTSPPRSYDRMLLRISRPRLQSRLSRRIRGTVDDRAQSTHRLRQSVFVMFTLKGSRASLPSTSYRHDGRRLRTSPPQVITQQLFAKFRRLAQTKVNNGRDSLQTS